MLGAGVFQKIQEAVDLGYIREVKWEGLYLYNYTNRAEYNDYWPEEVMMCRGLILDSQQNIVALPMKRFFNYLQGGRVPNGYMMEVTEKLDGSMGLLFKHEGRWRIATRGSFESGQALWATEFLNAKYKDALCHIPAHLTLMFEIIYPENRIVVNYGDRQGLVLIAVRNKATGDDSNFYPAIYGLAQELGFDTPKTFQFNSVHDIVDATSKIDASQEGWVARFSDGTRFKFKGDDYVYMHRIINQTTFKRVLEAVAGGHLDEMMKGVPDEFLVQVEGWRLEIDRTVQTVEDRVEKNFEIAPKDDRKTYALWVQSNCPGDAPYMFSRLDDKDYRDAIFKREWTR